MQDRFPGEGTHLARYAGVFRAVEINSSFHRPHRRTTYERWAASVPDDFRFAVKVPKAITHVAKLVAPADALSAFFEQAGGLGDTLGCVLVQLPPSLAFDAPRDDAFLRELRARYGGDVAVEPRHATWFEPRAAALLAEHRCARVAADPARVPEAALPGGWDGFRYWRWHGSPRVYYSSYPDDRLDDLAATLRACAARGMPAWCIFDNTTLGAATANALHVRARVDPATSLPETA